MVAGCALGRSISPAGLVTRVAVRQDGGLGRSLGVYSPTPGLRSSYDAKVRADVRVASFREQHTASCAGNSKKLVHRYDFRRYRALVGGGAVVQWPNFEDLLYGYFERPDKNDSDEKIFNAQRERATVSFSDLHTLIHQQVAMGHVGIMDATKHDGSMYVAFDKRVDARGSLDRYFIKVFPNTQFGIRNSRREEFFSYVATELDERAHVPTVGTFRLPVTYGGQAVAHYISMRPFYDGQDARFLSEPNPVIPPELTIDSLLRQFFLRYFVLHDVDRINPGNVIFTRGSRLTSKCFLHIDTEDVLPEEASMLHFPNEVWKPGEPFPYSLEWLDRKCAEKGGAEAYFERLVNTENPIMTLLHIMIPESQKDTSLLANLEIPHKIVTLFLERLIYIEQLAKTCGVVPLGVLQRDQSHFQQVARRILNYQGGNPNKPIKFIHAVTGQFDI